MIHEETICPYTGLRSFSEEESLYFRGRDGQIARVIQQLEERKFLMLTGASGDGKSSLVYAGLIPQARAGFFKAKHLNWKIVAFRPERSPLKNFARELTSALQMQDATVVENELSHGFSSLTEIYKATSTFIDTKDSSFTNASDEERESMDREAANLLVVVDQFEEFFTNPENFPNGIPSQDSRLVLNILLETVKISLRDDLPIYIVFTMRSDYIGQCAAFRGLPEFIGFSQFFVPRLQRKELQEVIEEPAILSGNRISKRLVDRLIYDLEDVEDHLPILQHALKEMWKVANEGRDEIDLVHYEKVGGKLSSVLDLHATKLYNEAAKVHKDARRIIAITFASLTRIDGNRAVRNRMTLAEITGIIDMPGVTTSVVDDVLRIFREPGNTLVRPYIDDVGNNTILDPDSILDITHEALIRNWKLLNKWAAKEFEYYNTYLDFRKQLQRWTDNGRSGNFLLPIGPLTYFENWFKESKPNAWWIRRYDLSDGNDESKLRDSQMTIDVSNQFLKKSASRVLVTRTFMKYGAGRITIVFAILVLLVAGGIVGYKWWSQRNESVINRVLANGEVLLQDSQANYRSVIFLERAIRIDPGYFKRVLAKSPDDLARARHSTFLAWNMLQVSPLSVPPLFFDAHKISDSLLSKYPQPEINDVHAVERYLHELNNLINLEIDYLYFNPDPVFQSRLDHHAKLLSKFTFRLLTASDPSKPLNRKDLNLSATTSLALKSFPSDSISVLINSLSPFGQDSSAINRFNQFFPVSGTIEVPFNSSVTHNGGYDLLAHLYAADGNWKSAARCIDSLHKYNSSYSASENNDIDVATSFFRYKHNSEGKEYLKTLAAKAKTPVIKYMIEVVREIGIFSNQMALRSIDNGNYNPIVSLFSADEIENLYEVYQSVVDDVFKNRDEHDFATAILLKQHGLLLARRSQATGMPVDTTVVNPFFREAIGLYNGVSKSFLNEKVSVFTMYMSTGGFTEFSIPRYRMFIYPDHYATFMNGFYTTFSMYRSDAFFKYIYEHHLVGDWYHTEDDYALITQWVNTSFFFKGIRIPFSNNNEAYLNNPAIDLKMLYAIDSLIVNSGFSKSLDNGWIVLIRINELLDQGKTDEALQQLKRIDLAKTSNVTRFFFEAIPFNNYITQTGNAILSAGLKNEASWFVRRVRAPQAKMIEYAELGITSFEMGNREDASRYLDSSYVEMRKVSLVDNFFRSVWDVRNPVVRLITLVKGRDGKNDVLQITGDMGDKKSGGIGTMVSSLVALGDNYAAETSIPSLSNVNDKLYLYSKLLGGEILKRSNPDDKTWYAQDELIRRADNFVIYGGNNLTF